MAKKNGSGNGKFKRAKPLSSEEAARLSARVSALTIRLWSIALDPEFRERTRRCLLPHFMANERRHRLLLTRLPKRRLEVKLLIPLLKLVDSDFTLLAEVMRELYDDCGTFMRELYAELVQVRNVFITRNLGLVYTVARRYLCAVKQSLTLEDLVQEGMLGMYKAITRFDPSLGYKFSTFATWWIRHAVLRAAQNKDRMVRVPVHFLDKHKKPYDGVKLIGMPISIDACMDGEDGEPLGLHGILVAPIEAPDHAIEMNARLEQAMEALTEKERGIVSRRYGLGAFKATGPKTLDQVGKDYGLTRERIRQIEVKALLLMRRHLSQQELVARARLSVPSSL